MSKRSEMKNMRLFFSPQEHAKLKEMKGDHTWEDFFLGLVEYCRGNCEKCSKKWGDEQ